ncbi:MAG: hypothetical protein WDZ88_03060 [Candidatus Paceibacterota bacterium]
MNLYVLVEHGILPPDGVGILKTNMDKWRLSVSAREQLCLLIHDIESPYITLDDVIRVWRELGLHDWVSDEGESLEWGLRRAGEAYTRLKALHQERRLV